MGAKSLVPMKCLSQITNPLWGITADMLGENNPNWSEFLEEKRRGDMFVTTRPSGFARKNCEDFFSEDLDGDFYPDYFFAEEECERDSEMDFDSLDDEEYIRAWEARLLSNQPLVEITPDPEEIISSEKNGVSHQIFIPVGIEKSSKNFDKYCMNYHRRGRKQAPTISERVRASRKALSALERHSEI